MAKRVPRNLSLMMCALALIFVASVHAGTTKPAKATKATAKTSASPTPAAAPAISPEMQLARKYSPIQYCHGASYPATSWMQIKDFQDKHSPPASDSPANSAATDPKLA